MNKKVFSIAGYALIILSFLSLLYPILILIISTYQGAGASRIFRSFIWEGLLPVSIIFLLTSIPGKVFIYVSKRNENTKLEAWSVVLSMISIVALFLYTLLGLFSADMEGFVWGLFMIFWFLFSPYFLALILLIINRFKNKSNFQKFKFKSWEKVLSISLLIFIIIVGLIYTIFSLSQVYQNSTRSLEICGAKENQEEANNCYTLLYLYKPELFYESEIDYCQKIIGNDKINIDRRDFCYEQKAYYFKDPSLCNENSSYSCRDIVLGL